MMNLVSTGDINNQQEVENNKSAYIIQQWYTRQSKFIQVKNNIIESISHVRMIKNSLVTLRASSGDFSHMQRNLSTPSFVTSLTAFLSILPLDPSLKAKNSLARNPRTIGSAFFIYYFPDEVLLDDEERDYSKEATESSKAAAMLVRSFDVFVNACSTLLASTADTDNSANCMLRQTMISYRFNIRYFIEKLDQWKELDASRLLDSLEQPYIECYTIFLTLSQALEMKKSSKIENEGSEEDGDESMCRAAELQCDKIRQAMVKLLGSRATSRLEELNAQIKASLSASTTDIKENSDIGTRSSSESFSIRGGGDSEGHRENNPISDVHEDVVCTSTSEVSPPPPLPQEFLDIDLILKRISGAGGLPPLSSSSTDGDPKSGTDLGGFIFGDERHKLLHELSMDQTYRLPDVPTQRTTDLSFYSKYFLPLPPNNSIKSGGWFDMIQADSYPRSRTQGQQSSSSSASVGRSRSTSSASTARDGRALSPLPPHLQSNIGRSRGGSSAPMYIPDPPLNPQSRSGAMASGLGDLGGDDGRGAEVDSRDMMQKQLEEISLKIKGAMMFMVDDNIVCSLSASPFAEGQDGLIQGGGIQIQVGMVLPVRYNNHKGGEEGMVLSSRVLIVHYQDVDSNHNFSNGRGICAVDLECLCDGSIEKNVALTRIKRSTDPPHCTPFLLCLQDTYTRLARLTPNRGDIHSDLLAAADFPLWSQMITNQAMTPKDIIKIFSHLFANISNLQAPVRTESFVQWTNDYLRLLSACSTFQSAVPLLPLFFEFTSSCVDEILRDMANFHVTTLIPSMKTVHGPAYLSHHILTSLLGRGIYLDSTLSVLASCLADKEKKRETEGEVGEALGRVFDIVSLGKSANASTDSADTSGRTVGETISAYFSPPPATVPSESAVSTKSSIDISSTAVVALSFIRLLQLPIRLNSPSAVRAQVLPETLLFDGQRLSLLRDLVDVISVQCAIMITVRQSLQQLGLLSNEADETVLYVRLNVLLRDPTIGLMGIVTEAVRFVTTAVAARDQASPLRATSPTKANLSPLKSFAKPFASLDWEEALEKSLRNVLADNNPVLLLFTKRIYKVMLRALLGQPFMHKLPSFSLQASGIQKNLSDLIGKAVRLFKFHMSVYGEVYTLIFASKAIQDYLIAVE